MNTPAATSLPRRPLAAVAAAATIALLALPSARAEPRPLSPPGPPLRGTAALETPGDLASNLVAGVDRFLDRRLSAARQAREAYWREASRDGPTWQAALRTQRARLAEILGAVETRPTNAAFETVASLPQSTLVATSSWVRVQTIRWPAFAEVYGEGLLLTPTAQPPVADIIAIPDADLTPEQLAGVDPGFPVESQFARRLAERGCRVVVPSLVNRNKGEPKVAWDSQRGRNLSHREFLHRAAFELGRTLAGYEVLAVLAAADALRTDTTNRALGVIGWGEGGRLALYAAALDPSFEAACVSAAFGPRDRSWEEPLDRNFFGLLDRLGDAEITALLTPRPLVIEAARGPQLVHPSDGGAPARLATIPPKDVRAEVLRARQIASGNRLAAARIRTLESAGGRGPVAIPATLDAFLEDLHALLPNPPEPAPLTDLRPGPFPGVPGAATQRDARLRRAFDRHTQQLLVDSPYARQTFLHDLDTSTPARFAETQRKYRDFFADHVIGRFADPVLPAKPRSRQAYDDPAWTGYEVVLEVYPEVFAYGLLLLPKDLREGERRPVVVCQHGLEGRPQDTIGMAGFEYYGAFAARLAERGFVTFAPQNLYIFHDRFRQLQRKANPLGKTLFSVIVPQHRQIVDWLGSLPFVDPKRIAFYGLSYGGKTAMRVPSLVTDYCLSICSADFNEWVWKNASTRSPYSYVWTGEYEIFEWNLGHTFNYAEMAALLAPRPFMVERGHFDGVAPDETVGYEFAKVRNLYAARLRLPPENCQIEWFVGPHSIHGVGTFEFLHRHLNWPAR